MKPKKNHDVFKALALISQLGISMIVPILLCLFIGHWLDEKLGTGFLVIIFLILGILTAYRSLYMYTRPLIKGSKEKENEAFWKSLDTKKDKSGDEDGCKR